ncbi:hypothetical protein BDC45DRAFT_574888 [Circinella umbellata]|nr:hypothetical protein BDC45DRAFT_574888 [Circinella umbellata]
MTRNLMIHTCNNIVSEFPDARKWLIWWLQPDVRNMIFVNGSIMKRSLRFHVCRTSNAMESFHRVFNTLIKGGQPLGSTLRRTLKLAKSDQDDLSQSYENGMLTTYNQQRKLRKPRRIGTKSYAENDGHAPDNTDAIFADENELRNQERFVLMNENELPALEVDDPTIQEELERIEGIEDYDTSVLIQIDELQESSSCEASLQPQSPFDYIDIDDDGCLIMAQTQTQFQEVSLRPLSKTQTTLKTLPSLIYLKNAKLTRFNPNLNPDNLYENMLRTTFEMTHTERRRDASNRTRAFIFQKLTNFHHGRMHDVCELAINYIQHCSQQFKDHFIIRRVRINQCHHDHEHMCFLDSSTDFCSSYNPVIEFYPSTLIAENIPNGPPENLTRYFSRSIHCQKDNARCFYCQESAITYYLPIHDLPPFLILRDNMFSWDEKYGNIPFPYNMTILQFNNYRLIALISSTERNGYHFSTTTIIETPNGPFIALMDNMKKPVIKLLSEKPEEFPGIFSKINYPVLAFYEKC